MKEKSHGHITPIYTFETVDPLSVRSFAPIKQLLPEEEPTKEKSITPSFSEQKSELTLPFTSQKLFPNVRLIQPIETLSLSPFLLSKIKGFRLEIIQDLILFIKKRGADQKGATPIKEKLSSSSIEEIEKKIMEETYQGSIYTPWVEWDRISTLFSISKQGENRAQNNLLSGSGKQIHISDSTSKRIRSLLIEMMNSIFTQSVAPWIAQRGGAIDIHELSSFLHLIAHPELLFENSPNCIDLAIQSIALHMNDSFLFSSFLIPFSPLESKKTLFFLHTDFVKEAEELYSMLSQLDPFFNVRENKSPFFSSSLINHIEKELLLSWKRTNISLIKRIVLWYRIL